MSEVPVDQKAIGAYDKFRVEWRDGLERPGGDRADSCHVVLDYVHDPHGLPAIEAYAASLAGEYPEFASDLRRIVAEGRQSP